LRTSSSYSKYLWAVRGKICNDVTSVTHERHSKTEMFLVLPRYVQPFLSDTCKPKALVKFQTRVTNVNLSIKNWPLIFLGRGEMGGKTGGKEEK